MRASGIDAGMMSLERLLADLDSGKVALPDFQRDFDWSESDIVALLVTVLAGWPAGSILLIRRGDALFFKLRPFEGTNAQLEGVRHIVLDGQQRLTSLYQALYNRGPRVYALDLDLLRSETELEEAIRTYRRSDWLERYQTPKAQFENKLVPLYALLSPSTFFEWRDKILAAAPEEERAAVKHRITDSYKNTLSAVHRYEFPAVTLDEETEPAAIARIFERVNRHGKKLGAFDLMVARVYEPYWNLRDKWDEARRETQHIDWMLEDDGLPLLQVMALRLSEDVRQSAVLRLAKPAVHEHWDSVVQAMEDALAFLRTQCGVLTPDALPYGNILVLFAALAVEYDLDDHSELLRRYFWGRSLGRAFDVAANTRIVSEYRAMRRALAGGESISDPVPVKKEIYLAAKRSHRAIWSVFRCSLFDSNAKGFLAETSAADPADPSDQRTVSIFPRGLEPEEPDLAPPHLRVPSLIHASARIARDVRRDGLRSVLSRLSDEQVRPALAAHFFPPYQDTIAALDADDWQTLLELRIEQFARYVAEATGLEFADAAEDAVRLWE